MPVWTRLLLIWLIAVMVPLKGLAAASMIGCGPNNHAAAGMAVDLTGGSAQHVHADAPPEAHAALDAAASLDGPGAADESLPDSAEAGDHLLMKCSSCAPCCAAAAPASEPSRFQPPRPEASSVPFADARYVGVITDVPHRPPRSSRD